MSVISKELFYKSLSPDIKCKDLIHPWSDQCISAWIQLIPSIFYGGLKFYLPIYSIKTAMNYKKIDKQFFLRILKLYTQSLCYVLVFFKMFALCFCGLPKTFGRFHYHGVTWITGIISGSAIFMESPENKMINAVLFFNLCLENLLRKLRKSLKYSQIVEITTFMALNAYFMRLLKNTKNPEIFWFYKPFSHECKIEADSNFNVNTKNHTACKKFWLQGFKQYFFTGFAVSLAKIFVSNLKVCLEQPRLVINRVLLRKDHILLGLFLGGYVGVYRVVSCLLREQKYCIELSGLLSGAVYCFKPNIYVLTLLLTNIFLLCSKKIQLNKKVPVKELIFMLSNGYLFHERLVSAEMCPSFYVKMLNKISCGVMDNLYKKFYAKIVLV